MLRGTLQRPGHGIRQAGHPAVQDDTQLGMMEAPGKGAQDGTHVQKSWIKSKEKHTGPVVADDVMRRIRNNKRSLGRRTS